MEETVVFKNFEEAASAHKKLFEVLREYGFVRYQDFLNICDLESKTEELVQYKYHGWYNLQNSRVHQYDEKYWAITMPEIEKLEGEKNNEK